MADQPTRGPITPGDGDPRHGTSNGYSNLKCRCDACRIAWAEYHRAWTNADPVRLERKRQDSKRRNQANRWHPPKVVPEKGVRPVLLWPPDEKTIERFWSKVVKTDTCWLWGGFRTHQGYGRFNLPAVAKGQLVRQAHRISYELTVGPVPEGLELDHLCRNPPCVNPAHLEAVTHRENMLRGDTIAARNLAKDHCPRGHSYDYVTPQGTRVCRTCMKAAQRAFYARQRNAR